jgi:myo-inositol-1(or 4)-monophosphatase
LPVDQGALDAREDALRSTMAAAGELALDRYAGHRDLGVAFKGPQDYLSAVDAEVEALLRQQLLRTFPGDSFLGEEGGGDGIDSVWVVDPIDGTANFLRGIPHFCISVGYLLDGRVRLGAILNPVTGELFFARQGRGAWLGARRLAAASTARIDHASVELGWSTRVPNAVYLALCTRVLDAGASFRRAGSGALGLAYVADGRQDAYVELHINAWDCLAGILLVEEAGGRTNDFLASNGLVAGNPILAVAPRLADEMAAIAGIALPVGSGHSPV